MLRSGRARILRYATPDVALMERYSGVARGSQAEAGVRAISDGAWDGGDHSSRDGGGMCPPGTAGQPMEASDGDGGGGRSPTYLPYVDGEEKSNMHRGWDIIV